MDLTLADLCLVFLYEDMVMMGSDCSGISNENKDQTFVPFQIHIIFFSNYNLFLILC